VIHTTMTTLHQILIQADLPTEIHESVLSIPSVGDDFEEHVSGLNLDVLQYDETVDDMVFSHIRNPDLIDLLVLYWAHRIQDRPEYSSLVDRSVQLYGKDALHERAWEYI